VKILRTVLIVLVLLWTAAAFSAQPTHLLVKVIPGSKPRLTELYGYSQLDIVPGESPMEPRIIALPQDLEFLTRHGYAYEILQQNLEQFYASRLTSSPIATMGGYHTYAEIQTAMDSIHNMHGAITSARSNIGNTLEGRGMWVMKISSSPNADNGTPEVFFNSLIHAREPEGMEALLYFMNWLTDNYGTDPMATYLVNNRQMYFLPCVNADGYVYNQTTTPGGGGMWRKNRRLNSDGSYGIDLNRNFDAAWGIDNNGSSPTPSDETYRGTAAFSELETQHLRDFINAHHFVTQEDCHTSGDYLLIPWGTSYYPPPSGNGLCPDDATYRMITDSMNYFIHSVNGVYYTAGTAWQVLYNTNGGSFDWEYGDASHQKIYAMTTEIGNSSDGFWPPTNRILPLAQENLPAFAFLARIAGLLAPRPYQAAYNAQCQSEINGNGNSITEPGEGLSLNVTLKNTGLNALTSITGVLTTSDPYVTITQGSSPWANLSPNATGANTTAFQISVSASCPATHFIPLNLHITAANLDTNITLSATVGNSCLYDQVENGTNGWTTGGTQNQWHIATRRANSPTHSWLSGADAGNYADNMSAYLLSPTMIMGPGAQLIYDQWYSLESNYDYGYVDINLGSGWTQVGTSVTGSSTNWLHVVLNLPVTCAGTPVQIRFRMTSDGNTNAEGWYLDNINTGCAAPASIVVSTPNGAENWLVGDVNNITWTSASISENVKIQLNRSYPSATWETLVASTGNTGSYPWTVTGPVTSTARVRITGITQTTVGDTSNANFTIGTRSITVTAPNGGETWLASTSYSITWTSANLSENVKIELNRSYPSATWETLIASTSNSGTYSWTATAPVTSAARVRISGITHTAVADTSNANFTIAQPGITVTSPNGNEVWILGENRAITWTSIGVIGNVYIDLNRAYPIGSWETLTSGVANTGSFNWIVTAPVATTARIRISKVGASSITDMSNGDFFISLPNQPPVIAHDPLHDQRPLPFTVTAIITDDAPGDATKFFYRAVGAPLFDSLAMPATGNLNEYAATAGPLAEGSFEYYLRTVDVGNLIASTSLRQFRVGSDCGAVQAYDDGVAERSSWSENRLFRWAVKFDAAPTPYVVCNAAVGISAVHPTTNHSPIQVDLLLADGPSGTPGTLVASRTAGSIGNVIGSLPATPANWTTIFFRDGSNNPPVVNGAFYIAVSNPDSTQFEAFLQDTTGALAGRSYVFDPCDNIWHAETVTDTVRYRGNRLIRVNGYGLVPPNSLVVNLSGADMQLSWANIGAPYYHIYSSPIAGGPFNTLEGNATTNSFIDLGAASEGLKFYQVRSSTQP
jgi:hypothetical protein